MTFLVTGATGFIGSYLIQRIAREGHVVVCVDSSPDHTGLSDKLGVDVIPCDVGDQEQVAALFRNVPPVNRVVHLAYVMGAESEADPSLAMRVNALGAANLFGAACETGVQRIIFLSSESVYGSQSVYGERPVREDDYCGPADHVLNYSLTKLLNEHLAAKYEARYGTEIIALRAPIVYGAGRIHGTTVWASDFASLPSQGLPVKLPFPANDVNCYIYVEDLVEQIYLFSLKRVLAHRVYNAGGHTVRGSELAEFVRSVLPNARIEFQGDGPGSPFIHSMDDARIRTEISFRMRSMAEGVQAHIAKAAASASTIEDRSKGNS
jgi:nucleoside-diphosphate-sugar epimerase